LSAEIRRAQLCDDGRFSPDRVAPNRRVSYRLDWGPATPYRRLVYPGDLHDGARQISILSPIGVALLGLREGDSMLVFLPDSGFHQLYVDRVEPAPAPS
jgi:regulator of nucleoside diphosphate kinase